MLHHIKRILNTPRNWRMWAGFNFTWNIAWMIRNAVRAQLVPTLVFFGCAVLNIGVVYLWNHIEEGREEIANGHRERSGANHRRADTEEYSLDIAVSGGGTLHIPGAIAATLDLTSLTVTEDTDTRLVLNTEEFTSPDLPEIPDTTTPVIGYRSWQMNVYAEQLSGYLLGAAWEPGITTARCMAHSYYRSSSTSDTPKCSRSPTPNCTCGLYALADPDVAPAPQDEIILGAVIGWGRVIVGGSGWRAEFAKPVAFLCPRAATWLHRRNVGFLAQTYGVPVARTLRELAEMAERGRDAFDIARPELALPGTPTGEIGGVESMTIGEALAMLQGAADERTIGRIGS